MGSKLVLDLVVRVQRKFNGGFGFHRRAARLAARRRATLAGTLVFAVDGRARLVRRRFRHRRLDRAVDILGVDRRHFGQFDGLVHAYHGVRIQVTVPDVFERFLISRPIRVAFAREHPEYVVVGS